MYLRAKKQKIKPKKMTILRSPKLQARIELVSALLGSAGICSLCVQFQFSKYFFQTALTSSNAGTKKMHRAGMHETGENG